MANVAPMAVTAAPPVPSEESGLPEESGAPPPPEDSINPAPIPSVMPVPPIAADDVEKGPDAPVTLESEPHPDA